MPPAGSVQLMRSLFPELARSLDASLSASLTAGNGTGTGTDSLDAWIDAETSELRLDSSAIGFGPIGDDGVRNAFTAAYGAARVVSAWAGIDVPEPEEFAEQGVNLTALGDALAADPQLTIVPAPHGLGLGTWKALFTEATERDGSPLKTYAFPDGGSAAGIVFAPEIERWFAALDQVQDQSSPAVRKFRMPHREVEWTLRLVPSGDASPKLGLPFSSGPHPSVPEILMLQLMRIVLGEAPIDTHTFTWLAGELPGATLAARHVFAGREGVVRIDCRDVAHQGPHLGARPPVG